MPRRFAFLLLGILLSVLLALLVARTLKTGREAAVPRGTPTPVPTPVVPPTPIPPRRVVLFFESAEDGKLHPEARDVDASADAVALLRSVAGAVLEGPQREGLLRPFPHGWSLRAAFRMADGLAVLDLATPPELEGPPSPLQAPGPGRWEAGSAEEVAAAQALVVSVTRSLGEVTRVVLLVDGEPQETLAGHLDLTHALVPDASLVADEPAGDPPSPTPTPGPAPEASPAPSPAASPTRTPRREPPPVPTGRGAAV